MRLLLDECVPHKFKQALPGHTVATVSGIGWAGKRNGDVLAGLRESKFDAFITVDQNLQFQQNLRASGTAVIVMQARSNRLKDLLPLAGEVQRALSTIRPGELKRVRG